MIQQPQLLDSHGVNMIIQLCDSGYRSANPGYYSLIKEIAERYVPSEKLTHIIKLAESGPGQISKRFNYPHIQSEAQDLKQELKL